jgi:mRNA interferase HicA
MLCAADLLDIRTQVSDRERRVRKLARRRNESCVFVPALGKGSHGRLYLGDEFTTLNDRKKEIGRDLLTKMCRDLGIDPHDL